jgi:hypothetical protein
LLLELGLRDRHENAYSNPIQVFNTIRRVGGSFDVNDVAVVALVLRSCYGTQLLTGIVCNKCVDISRFEVTGSGFPVGESVGA